VNFLVPPGDGSRNSLGSNDDLINKLSFASSKISSEQQALNALFVDASQGGYTPAFNRSVIGSKFGFTGALRERPSMMSQGFSFASGSGHNSFGVK
jgi:hypothetical protein